MELSIYYKNKKIKFIVEKKKRKTLSIKVVPPQKVLVSAPLHMEDQEILSIVAKKGRWINNKLVKLKEIKVREYKEGELFLYLGKNYPLKININKNIKKPKVKLYEDELIIQTHTYNKNVIKEALEKWYREQTIDKVTDITNHYIKYMDVNPRIIKIKEQKKMWGSCSSKGNIYINWRCSMLPLELLEYIVVHEMCHLKFLNHSKDYWNYVGSIIPDYKE